MKNVNERSISSSTFDIYLLISGHLVDPGLWLFLHFVSSKKYDENSKCMGSCILLCLVCYPEAVF